MCIWRAGYMGTSKGKQRNPVRPKKLVSPTLHKTNQEDAQEGTRCGWENVIRKEVQRKACVVSIAYTKQIHPCIYRHGHQRGDKNQEAHKLSSYTDKIQSSPWPSTGFAIVGTEA